MLEKIRDFLATLTDSETYVTSYTMIFVLLLSGIRWSCFKNLRLIPSYRTLWKYTAASPTIYDVLLKHLDVFAYQSRCFLEC